MKDLGLGPQTEKLLRDRARLAAQTSLVNARREETQALLDDMSRMLARWLEEGWCYPDGCPVKICGGPHVLVRYPSLGGTEVIEPLAHMGETFGDTDYIRVTPDPSQLLYGASNRDPANADPVQKPGP